VPISPKNNEVRDTDGSTTHETGTVGTTPIQLPSSPGLTISEVLINTQSITSQANKLLVSFDGGTTFMTFKRNTIVGWSVKSKPTQIDIKGNNAGVEYDILINFETT
jgi:hypothetical protein